MNIADDFGSIRARQAEIAQAKFVVAAEIDPEQALLGAILTDNGAYRTIAGMLRPEHFAEPMHGRIYAVSAALIDAGNRADLATMRLMFDQDPDLEKLGGSLYLDRLWGHPAHADDIAELAGEIIDRAGATA